MLFYVSSNAMNFAPFQYEVRKLSLAPVLIIHDRLIPFPMRMSPVYNLWSWELTVDDYGNDSLGIKRVPQVLGRSDPFLVSAGRNYLEQKMFLSHSYLEKKNT